MQCLSLHQTKAVSAGEFTAANYQTLTTASFTAVGKIAGEIFVAATLPQLQTYRYARVIAQYGVVPVTTVIGTATGIYFGNLWYGETKS